MQDLELLEQRVQQIFERIHREQMEGLPLLNPMLRVQTVGFQVHEGRCMGVVITPWMMSLMLFPNAEDQWDDLQVGHKQPQVFPANSFKFMVNEFDGIGRCQTHSLYSPMHEFTNQDHALAAAESFLKVLMVPVEKPETDPHDEELLGRILRGEVDPDVDHLDGLATLDTERLSGAPEAPAREELSQGVSRRDLLRGRFS